MAVLHLHLYLMALGCWVPQLSSSFLLPNATELLSPAAGTAAGLLRGEGIPRGRRRRHLSPHDMSVILDYHNQVRAQVSPPAANMEFMVSWALAGQVCAHSSGGLQGLTCHGVLAGFLPEPVSWGMFYVPGAEQNHAASMQEGWSPSTETFPHEGRFRICGPVSGTSGSLRAVGWQDPSS